LVGALAGPAVAVSVSDEAELRAAFATDTSIDVEADITLIDCSDGGDVARLPGVTDPVTINGHGHTIRQTCPHRVFFQGGSGLMTVRNLTITGGNSPVSANGGGIPSASPLTMENSTVVKNQAGGAGSAIASDGPTTITLIDAIPISACQTDGAAGITVDQRGVTRPQGPRCDIGAVEAERVIPPEPPVPPTPPAPVTPRFTG